MAILGVDDFQVQTQRWGRTPNLFKATVNFPAYAGGDVELTSFLCKLLNFLLQKWSALLFHSVVEHYRWQVDREFEPWSPTIINDTDFQIRNAMERWMNGMNGHTANTGITNPVDYQADLIVEQLDRDGSTLKTYNFRGCFPTEVAAMTFRMKRMNVIEEFC